MKSHVLLVSPPTTGYLQLFHKKQSVSNFGFTKITLADISSQLEMSFSGFFTPYYLQLFHKKQSVSNFCNFGFTKITLADISSQLEMSFSCFCEVLFLLLPLKTRLFSLFLGKRKICTIQCQHYAGSKVLSDML